MATPSVRLTYEDYVHFPEGERWELIDGVAYVVPSPNERHQTLLGELYLQIANHVKGQGGGRVYVAPFDVVLAEGDVFQPDIVFIADEDLDVLTEANVWGPPSWVVEVLSKDTARDRKLKHQRYERFGVPEYWIVDPAAERLEVYRLQGKSYREPAVHQPPARISPLRPSTLGIDLEELFSGAR